MTYKALFIDWDGTLSRSRFWERWKNSPEDNAKYHRLQDALFIDKAGKLLIKDWMMGLRSYNDILTYASRVTAIPYENLANELQYSAENMKFLDENALGLIQLLRAKGLKVLIASDNMDTFRNWTVPALGLEALFDGILVSDTRGAMKSHISPDGFSVFFHPYLSQQAIKADETVLIDDSLNTKVVERIGINFLHVNESASLTDHLQNIFDSHH